MHPSPANAQGRAVEIEGNRHPSRPGLRLAEVLRAALAIANGNSGLQKGLRSGNDFRFGSSTANGAQQVPSDPTASFAPAWRGTDSWVRITVATTSGPRESMTLVNNKLNYTENNV